ncbi:MAG TPA: Ku protein, partial [Ramlibacter sp.]|nr:Ku protein [Ramlibacter sp.]
LHSATQENRMKFNLLDKRTMNPVGNQQVNKATGESMAKEEIVKGFEYEKDQYVTLSSDEIKAALPRSTQTIEIESFVSAGRIPTEYFNKPYYVAPASKGQKPYRLLEEALKKTGKVGLARVVISTRQHLAALVPSEHGLVLELLRWADEVRSTAGLPLPTASDAKVTERELKMAEQLVNELASEWEPDLFHDEFREKLEALVEQKVKSGEGEQVMKPLPGEEVKTSAEVIDLTELLRRSLDRGGKTALGRQEAAPAKTAKARQAANDEENEEEVAPAPRKRAAAAGKSASKASSSVKAKPRRKAA